MKRMIAMLLTIGLLLSFPIVTASAAETEASNKCGENLTWSLEGANLTISGTGPMYDYSPENPAPWSQSITFLSTVYIKEGVTTIGEYTFAQKPIEYSVYIPDSMEFIGNNAFRNCKGKIYFMGDAPQIAEDAFPPYSFQNVYAVNWSEEEKQSLGLKAPVTDTSISFDALNSNLLVGLNEELKAENLAFKVRFGFEMAYTPRQVEFGPYDNSTYGEKKVSFTADGHSFEMTYFVTDGRNHLDLINVAIGDIPVYYTEKKHTTLSPTVTMGTMELAWSDHYDISTIRGTVGTFGQFTITGKGIAEGYEKTFYYPVLKGDISDTKVSAKDQSFTGLPMETRVDLYGGVGFYYEDTTHRVFFENNVNPGTATAGAVGIGSCYGITTGSYSITCGRKYITLLGNCIGQIDGELSEDIPVYEQIITPYELIARIDSSGYNVAAYALYEMKEDQVILVEEQVGDGTDLEKIAFKYDFSSVYNDAANEGGAIYLLSYSWVNERLEVYAGATILYVPAKVLDATSMTMNHIEGDGDFRKEYFYLSGDDGALGDITWYSSDSSVATVEQGVVTLHKPGTVQITGQYGNMVRTCEIQSPTLDLTKGIIFDCDPQAGSARVIWDSRLLTEGTDYTLSLQQTASGTQVTVTGCGLFSGELVKIFDGMDSFADLHTHGFDNGCDGTCNGCDFTRENDHSFAQEWTKDQINHWHACTACGEKADTAAHILISDTECEICGTLYIPGDLNGDWLVNNKDVEHLLWHTLFPDNYPLLQSADLNGDGSVNNKDVEFLLWHTLFPDSYPLS